MRGRFRVFLRQEAGASAVEFALVAPAFLLLLLGTIEFGRALWTREALVSVASNSARCMGVRNASCAPSGAYSETATKTFAVEEGKRVSVNISSDAVALNASTTCAGVSGFSQVTITYTFQTVVPLVVTPLKNGIPLTVTSCFPNQPTS